MVKVILLRHGQTTYNAADNKYCGRTDVGLTKKGIQQAEEVAKLFEGLKIDAVYSSPLQRALITAHIVSGNKNVVADERLIEADWGQWEGKTKAEFNAQNPLLWKQWMSDPETSRAGGTGETGGQIVARAKDFFDEIHNKHQGQLIMVVAHNGINRLYLASKLGMPLCNYRRFDLENSAITFFELDDENIITLKKLNAHFF